MPEKLEEWLIAHPFIGVMLMAVLGGIVAHIKNLAKTLPESITREEYFRFTLTCTAGFIGRLFSAGLGGLMVLFLWRTIDYRWELGFVVAGLAGLFATEFFDWLWAVGRAYAQKKIGVTKEELQEPK